MVGTRLAKSDRRIERIPTLSTCTQGVLLRQRNQSLCSFPDNPSPFLATMGNPPPVRNGLWAKPYFVCAKRVSIIVPGRKTGNLNFKEIFGIKVP